MDSTTAAALAAQLRARAPAGTQVTTMDGYAAPGQSSSGFSVHQTPRPDRSVDPYAQGFRGLDLDDRLLDVIGDLRAAVPAAVSATVHVQLRVPAEGPWELAAVWEDGSELSDRGYTRVLDPQARPAEPPSRPDALPGPRPAAPAVAEVVRPKLGDFATLKPPATGAQLAAAEAAIGRALPGELRDLYAVADGGELAEDADGLFRGWGWLSLEQLVDEHAWIAQPFWPGWELGWDDSHLEPVPLGTVGRRSGHPGWIPFLTDHGGNFVAVDTAPGPAGQPRQVIVCGRNYDSPIYAAASVTDLIGHGSAEVPDGRAFLMLQAPQLEAYGAITDSSSTPALTALVVAEPHLQELILHGVPVVDTQDLVGLDRLRALRVRGPDIRLLGLQRVPLETLRLNCAQVDLTGLTRHATLRRLELTSPTVTGLEVLAGWPQLEGLDLAGCPTLDVAILGTLPGLSYLRLTHDQWRRLARAGRPRFALSALTIADHDRLWDALEIAHWFDPADRPLAATTRLVVAPNAETPTAS